VQLLNGAGDATLTAPAGTARVAGAQSNPSANVYKTVSTISFSSSLTITEWALSSSAAPHRSQAPTPDLKPAPRPLLSPSFLPFFHVFSQPVSAWR
jgi:hypothetical protein